MIFNTDYNPGKLHKNKNMSREMKVSSILTHEVFQEQQSRSGEM
jgi:hypothetical protein